MGEIQFPIEVSKININPLYRDKNRPDGLFGERCGHLVAVRPIDEKYGKKTYLGILLGDLPLEAWVSHNRETKELTIAGFRNPAMFVPELREIIWGVESWWETIETEDQLHQISDDEIQHVWYVQLLKAMLKNQPTEGDSK